MVLAAKVFEVREETNLDSIAAKLKGYTMKDVFEQEENRIELRDRAAVSSFLSRDEDAAFYHGKVYGARYFIKNVLPQADALAAAIRSEDPSTMSIHDAGF